MKTKTKVKKCESFLKKRNFTQKFLQKTVKNKKLVRILTFTELLTYSDTGIQILREINFGECEMLEKCRFSNFKGPEIMIWVNFSLQES